MRRRQNWLALVFIMAMALALTGCGNSSATSSSAASGASGDTVAATTEVGTYGTDSYETEDASTSYSYATADAETAEMAEESLASSSDSSASGTVDFNTLTDADVVGASEGTETGESKENTETGESSEGTESGESSDDTETGKSSEEADTSSYEQKLIRTVNLSAETTDFDKLVAGVKAKTEELGGYVESSEMNTSTDSTSRWAYLTLRIPAEKLDSFVAQVNEDANVTYSSESTEDVTLTYTDLESHVKALRTEQETLLSMLEQATTMEDILAIQSQLTEVRYEIESYESQLKVYDNKVTYSTVYLDISEVTRESTGTGVTFSEQAGNLFKNNLYNIADGFRNFAIGFLGAIPYLIILAVVVVVGIFVWKKVRKMRRVKKLEEKDVKNPTDGKS